MSQNTVGDQLVVAMKEALDHAQGKASFVEWHVYDHFKVAENRARFPIMTHKTIHGYLTEGDLWLTLNKEIPLSAHKPIIEELRILDKCTWAGIHHYADDHKDILNLAGFKQVGFDFANLSEYWFLDKTPGSVERKLFASDPLDLIGACKINLARDMDYYDYNRIIALESNGLDCIRWGNKIWNRTNVRNAEQQGEKYERFGVQNGEVSTIITPVEGSIEVVAYDLLGAPYVIELQENEWAYIDVRRPYHGANEIGEQHVWTCEVMSNPALRYLLRRA